MILAIKCMMAPGMYGRTCSSPSCGFRGRIQCSNLRVRFRSIRAALRTTERTAGSPPSCEYFQKFLLATACEARLDNHLEHSRFNTVGLKA